ncbi:BnaC03g14110D [Brassica napus]|uniref:Protein TIC 20 n=2 Tax=Brassica TaxID=3705 RepID=A0A078FC65_BRANA|nr:PREDICTED: protein TIC 20-v, chloroplastic-like [Brassica oleracea var. oleracea]XP_048608286.1 protein TIC 20-v, chloroplastic-like [Brassica napus]KAG2297189.1 hypothetical protein Bca52824_043858 [Brassica carinata]CAF1698908.1 unnamed protein product [Brassica napus]CDY11985.1 BnaC03g14110D [Brassica napus]
MAISHLLSPLPSLTFFQTKNLTLTGRFSSSLPLNSNPHFPKPSPARERAASTLVLRSKGDDSVDASDRLISAVCYFYPFFDGIQYGKFIITQYQPFQILIQPLFPAIKAFKSFPFNGFLIFITLYFVVVRNQNFSRYVRFNTMQAIVLDVLLIFPDLLERSFNPTDGFGLDVVMSLDSTVFLFLLVSLIYGFSACLFGLVPRLPIVADAADRQVL